MLVKEEVKLTLQGLILIRAHDRKENGETAARRVTALYHAARKAGYGVERAIDIVTADVMSASENKSQFKARKQAEFEAGQSYFPENFDVIDKSNRSLDRDDIYLAVSEHQPRLHAYLTACQKGKRRYSERMAQMMAANNTHFPHKRVKEIYGL